MNTMRYLVLAFILLSSSCHAQKTYTLTFGHVVKSYSNGQVRIMVHGYPQEEMTFNFHEVEHLMTLFHVRKTSGMKGMGGKTFTVVPPKWLESYKGKIFIQNGKEIHYNQVFSLICERTLHDQLYRSLPVNLRRPGRDFWEVLAVAFSRKEEPDLCVFSSQAIIDETRIFRDSEDTWKTIKTLEKRVSILSNGKVQLKLFQGRPRDGGFNYFPSSTHFRYFFIEDANRTKWLIIEEGINPIRWEPDELH